MKKFFQILSGICIAIAVAGLLYYSYDDSIVLTPVFDLACVCGIIGVVCEISIGIMEFAPDRKEDVR